MAIGDLDRLPQGPDQAVPRATSNVLGMPAPHVLGIARAGTERDDPGIKPAAGRGQVLETSKVLVESDGTRIAEIERARDRGHRQAPLAELAGDPDATVLVQPVG